MGLSSRIGVPGSSTDLKYHYTQGMAIHYLLTGDERFRESAEDVATRISSLWSSPRYNGGADFWTERHAGFGLLGYLWALAITDDQKAFFTAEAHEAVEAYLRIQSTFPTFWDDEDARCFAHTAESHGESFDGWGCSPWMSSILAESLNRYVEAFDGTPLANDTSEAIVRLGRMIASEGLDATGKPLYWMGVGAERDRVDDYDEHWGEVAHVLALAWIHSGREEASLFDASMDLVRGLSEFGSAPYTRSFNWQCRAAVTTPYYLQN